MIGHKPGEPKIKILIIDDDPFVLDLYKLALEEGDFDVLSAPDGESGLRAVYSEKPDVILLDLLMPNMDGFEVLAKLKVNERTKAIPVIVLSSMQQDEDVDRALKAGAVAYLKKAQSLPSEAPMKIREALGLSSTAHD